MVDELRIRTVLHQRRRLGRACRGCPGSAAAHSWRLVLFLRHVGAGGRGRLHRICSQSPAHAFRHGRLAAVEALRRVLPARRLASVQPELRPGQRPGVCLKMADPSGARFPDSSRARAGFPRRSGRRPGPGWRIGRGAPLGVPSRLVRRRPECAHSRRFHRDPSQHGANLPGFRRNDAVEDQVHAHGSRPPLRGPCLHDKPGDAVPGSRPVRREPKLGNRAAGLAPRAEVVFQDGAHRS